MFLGEERSPHRVVEEGAGEAWHQVHGEEEECCAVKRCVLKPHMPHTGSATELPWVLGDLLTTYEPLR